MASPWLAFVDSHEDVVTASASDPGDGWEPGQPMVLADELDELDLGGGHLNPAWLRGAL
jgi:hypothetical protein